MASAKFTRFLSEYRSLTSKRDNCDRQIVDLANLLDQIFPSLYHANMSDPPDYPLPKEDPRYNPPWLPEDPPLPPLPINDPPFNLASNLSAAPSRSHPVVQPSMNHPRASDGRVDNVVTEPNPSLNVQFTSNTPSNPAGDENMHLLYRAAAGHLHPSANPAPQVPFLSAGAPHQRSFPILPPLTPASFAPPHSTTSAASHNYATPGISGSHYGPTPPVTTPSVFATPTLPTVDSASSSLPPPGLQRSTAPTPSHSSADARPASAAPARTTAPPMALQPAPPGRNRPTAHMRTSSIASSYTSASAFGPNPRNPRALTSPPATSSAASTESVNTPSTSGLAQVLQWPSTHATNRSSGPSAAGSSKSQPPPSLLNRSQLMLGARSQTTGVSNAPIHSGTRGAAFSPRVALPPLLGKHHAPQPPPPPPPPAELQPSEDVAMATLSPEPTGVDMGGNPGDGNGDGDFLLDEGEGWDEDEGEGEEDEETEGEGNTEVETGLRKGAKPHRKPGGEPYITEEESNELFSKRRRGPYRMAEFGYVVHDVFAPSAPDSAWREALTAGSNTRLFQRMAHDIFRGSRTPASVSRLFKKLKSIYTSIQTYSESFPLPQPEDFHPDREQETLERITRQLDQLEATGGVELDVNAWQLYVFTRSNWIRWMRTRLEDSAAMTTSTDLHSSNISPPRSRSSRGPRPSGSSRASRPPASSHAPQPSASSSRVPQSSASSSRAPAPPPFASSSHVPPPASATESSSASKRKGKAPAREPQENTIVGPHLPPAPGSSSASIPGDTPDARKPRGSSLRAPRNPTTGRSSRKALSSVGSASGRPSRAALPTRTAPPSLAADQSAGAQAIPPPPSGTQAVPPPPSGAQAVPPPSGAQAVPPPPSGAHLAPPTRAAPPTHAGPSAYAAPLAPRGFNNQAGPSSYPYPRRDDEIHGIDEVTDPNAHEMARDQRAFRKRSLQYREQQVKYERRAMEIRLQILEREQSGIEREREQRM
ncbi:hypothetical protein FRC08_000877 [Ceratobasidium sp. 394]|nr:hypothetical protein FRC08_000877 [Ceratobasidium sp. 394]